MSNRKLSFGYVEFRPKMSTGQKFRSGEKMALFSARNEAASIRIV